MGSYPSLTIIPTLIWSWRRTVARMLAMVGTTPAEQLCHGKVVFMHFDKNHRILRSKNPFGRGFCGIVVTEILTSPSTTTILVTTSTSPSLLSSLSWSLSLSPSIAWLFHQFFETWKHNWPLRETTQWQRGPHIRWGNWFESRKSFSWLKSFHACTAKIFST